MTSKADLIFYGGEIITMDEDATGLKDASCSGPTVEAVAVADGKILQVGMRKDIFELVGDATQVIFLSGQTLMPGFIEPHQHACITAENRSRYKDIGGVKHRSYAEVSNTIKKRLNEVKPDEWALFVGWDPELIPDLPELSATHLDENYSSTVPIVIVGQNWHVCWANTPAMNAAKIDANTPNPIGGEIVRNEASKAATGQFLEFPGMRLLFKSYPKLSPEHFLKSFKEQWRFYSSVGFTTMTELAFMPNNFLRMILVFLACESECPIRLALYTLEHASRSHDLRSSLPSQDEFCPNRLNNLPSCHGKELLTPSTLARDKSWIKDRLWIAGIKMMADGSPHCGSAAVMEPYLENYLTEILGFPKAPNYGKLNMESDALVDAMKFYDKQGIQVAIHSHGERASDQVLKAYEQAIGSDGKNDNRHRMEHCGLTTVEQLNRAAKSNITISFFIDHLRFYAESYKTKIFGERVNRWTPLSEATKAGIKWTIHQDHPAFPGEASPFSNMKTAITRCSRDDPTTPYGPEYRVSIHEALKAYTINAAWQLHRDHDLGSITPGKTADLVVLSKNPYDVDPFDLESIQVVETYLDGRSNGLASVKSVPGNNFSVLERKTE